MTAGDPASERPDRLGATARGPDGLVTGNDGPPSLDIAAGTDVGKKREINQDAALGFRDARNRFATLVVCDGLGGLESGEVAAEITIERIRAALESCEDQPGRCLERGILAAHHAVRDVAGERRMGTTVVAVVLGPGGFEVMHVGDSRAYLLRDGTLRPLTVDHSWVMEQVAAGRMSPEQAERDPRRNIVTRALGTDVELNLQLRAPEPLQPGDTFLVCSDGLSGVLPAKEIALILGGPFDAEMAVKALIMRANQLGGPDNIGVAVARVGGGA